MNHKPKIRLRNTHGLLSPSYNHGSWSGARQTGCGWVGINLTALYDTSTKRTQVQIPDPLYEDIKRIAERRDWSVSEVFRRALEEYVAEVPELREEGGWVLPPPREMGEPNVDPERWRDLLADDEAGV